MFDEIVKGCIHCQFLMLLCLGKEKNVFRVFLKGILETFEKALESFLMDAFGNIFQLVLGFTSFG
jgi:hypothetical protein